MYPSTDCEQVFTSHFWREMFKLPGTHLKFSSACHPETDGDGKTEVVNHFLETYLRCFAANQPKVWGTWIPWAADDATSEDVSTMRSQFPTFEDNVGVSEGSIVNNHVAENDPNEFIIYH